MLSAILAVVDAASFVSHKLQNFLYIRLRVLLVKKEIMSSTQTSDWLNW